MNLMNKCLPLPTTLPLLKFDRRIEDKPQRLKGWKTGKRPPLRQLEVTPDPKRKRTCPEFRSRVRRRQIRPWPPSFNRFAISNNLLSKDILQCYVAYRLNYLTVFIWCIPRFSFFPYLARLFSSWSEPNPPPCTDFSVQCFHDTSLIGKFMPS